MSNPIINSVKYENNYITLGFDQGVFSTSGGSGALETTDFSLAYVDNSDTGSSNAAITAISKTTNAALAGGETSLRLHLTTTGIPVGAVCTLHAASAKTDTLKITNSVNANYLMLKFNLTTNTGDTLVVEQDISTYDYVVNIKLANTTASKNTAALIQAAIRALVQIGANNIGGFIDVSAITCTAGGNWNTAAIATGETVNYMIGGLATFEITAASNAIYNAGGEAMATSQTTGVYNLNSRLHIFVAKTGNDANSGLVVTLPKLTLTSGGPSIQATGLNCMLVGIGEYAENGNIASTAGKIVYIEGDSGATIFGGSTGTVRWTTTSNTNESYITRYKNFIRTINWAAGVLFDASSSLIPHRFINYTIELNTSTCLFYSGVGGYPVAFCNSPLVATSFNPTLQWEYQSSGNNNEKKNAVYLNNCDWVTNAGPGGFSNIIGYMILNDSQFRGTTMYGLSGGVNVTNFVWNTGCKHNWSTINYKIVSQFSNLLFTNLTNVSTTLDFYNFWNSTAALAYSTGTGVSNPCNTVMYIFCENAKLYINGINSDEIRYVMYPTGVFIKNGGTHNNCAQWDFLCSKVDTTGIYRFWYKLKVADSTSYTMTYDFKRYFTTATAKNIKIEITKGQSIAESTAVATVTKLASNYTDNTWYDTNALNFTTLADNDEYYLSILLPKAVSTNNVFSFVLRSITAT